MPSFDAAARAHLDSGDATLPVFLAFFDVAGDPIRATTLNYPVTLPGHADPDLSGRTFSPAAGVLDVGDVTHAEGGSETLTVELSGLLLPDAELLAALGDRSNWQRRAARLWVILRGEDRSQIGAIANYYTGEMSSVRLRAGRERQTIALEIEGYKALLTRASNRSYLDQARYDPGDLSAQATIGASNGARSGPAALSGGGGLGGMGGSGNVSEVFWPNETVIGYR
jgi:hypothetical protein